MPDEDIIAGSDAQVAMVRRAQALHALLHDDPRFCFQARTVSLVGLDAQAVDTTIALARLQGYSSVQFAPRQEGASIAAAFRAAGLSPVTWDQYWGRDSALEASRTFLDGFDAPAGLTLHKATPRTDDATIRAICELSLAQGVVPPPGSAMRGAAGPRGAFFYVADRNGAVAAVGGGFMSYHPDSPRADEAFWGMLATAPEWRGQRLACWVGARAVQALHDRYGARGFSSGVKPDNPASQAMCSRLGITRSEFIYAGAVDPVLMGSAPVTR